MMLHNNCIYWSGVPHHLLDNISQILNGFWIRKICCLTKHSDTEHLHKIYSHIITDFGNCESQVTEMLSRCSGTLLSKWNIKRNFIRKEVQSFFSSVLVKCYIVLSVCVSEHWEWDNRTLWSRYMFVSWFIESNIWDSLIDLHYWNKLTFPWYSH